MRQRDHCGTMNAPCADGRGHRTSRSVLQCPPLSVTADQKRQFHFRKTRQERPSPERGATRRRRVVAAFRIGPWEAKSHRGHANSRVCIERIAIQPKPLAQAISREIIEWKTALMHPPSRCLAADQETRFRGYLNHRAWFVAEFRSARTTRTDSRKQRVKLRLFQPCACFAAPQVEFSCSSLHRRSGPIAALPSDRCRLANEECRNLGWIQPAATTPRDRSPRQSVCVSKCGDASKTPGSEEP